MADSVRNIHLKEGEQVRIFIDGMEVVAVGKAHWDSVILVAMTDSNKSYFYGNSANHTLHVQRRKL